MRRKLAALAAAALLTLPAVAAPSAALAQNQDGLVNVAIGDVTLEDINIGLAAQIVAAACDTVEVNAAVIGAVDRGGDDVKCTADGQPVTVTQN